MLEAIITSSCAAQVHPTIVNAIVKTESNFNPFAIGINKGVGRLSKQPRNYAEAVTTAKQLLARGVNIDMGLAQINSSNMTWLGLTVEMAFHPCHNLQAMQTVYLHCLQQAKKGGQGTLEQRAWSCYNTGNTKRGFANGYVDKVTHNFNFFAGMAQKASPQNRMPQNEPVSSQKGVQAVVATQLPKNAQNVSVGNTEQNNTTLPTPPKNTPENKIATEPVAKVRYSWDVFGDF